MKGQDRQDAAVTSRKSRGLAPALVTALVAALMATGCGTDDSLHKAPDASKAGAAAVEMFRKPASLANLEQYLGVFGSPGSLGADAVRKELDAVLFSADEQILGSGAGALDAPEFLEMMGTAPGELESAGERRTSLSLADAGSSVLRWKNMLHEKDTAGTDGVSDWRLYRGAVPVEGVQLRALERGGVMTYSQGNIPRVLATQARSVPLRAIGFALSAAQAREAVAWRLNFHPWRVSVPSPVYILGQNSLAPAYKAQVDSGADAPGRGPDWPLEILVDGRTGDIISRKVLAFHIDGKAKLYDENVVTTPTLSEVKLASLKGDGSKLSNPLFNVANCGLKEASANCSQDARSVAGDFTSITPDAKEFDELIAYHAITKSMAWHRALMALAPAPTKAWGADYPGTRANFGLVDGKLSLTVYVRALTKGPTAQSSTLDNAAYMPSSLNPGSMARIIIGTGWEQGQPEVDAVGNTRILRYLGHDTDVAMHEFGHHILYRTLRSVGEITSQTAGLHEGMADYFTYAITGNNLLGESIVSVGNSLRAGNKGGKIDPFIGARAHRAGEYWSSTMWEVRGVLGAWKGDYAIFDKIVFESIDLFKENAGYYDVISALAKSADGFAVTEKRSAKDIKEKMFGVFHKRGFIERPTGDGKLPAATQVVAVVSDTVLPPAEDPVVNVTSSSTKEWYECGSVAGVGAARGGGVPFSFAALLALPLAFPILASLAARTRARRERVRVRAPRRSREH